MLTNVLEFHAIEGGPLSLFKTWGIPCLAKIASSFGMVDPAEVDAMISASGIRLYSFVATVRYSSERSGLTKSSASSFHGALGSVVVFRGSSRPALPLVAAWHGKQQSTSSLTILSTPENQTFPPMRRLVFTILGVQCVLGPRLCLSLFLGLRSCFPPVKFIGRPIVHVSYFCTLVPRDVSTGQSRWP